MRLVDRLVRALWQRWRSHRAVRVARAASDYRLGRGPIRRALIVCYGNIYRSPFVGEYLRIKTGMLLEVRTAGFHPVPGRPAPDSHVAMCKRRGVFLERHRSSIVTSADLEWADAIVIMDRHNWSALDLLGVDHEKILWAGAVLEGSVEIEDPYGRSEVEAEAIIDRLQQAASRLAALIEKEDGE